MQKVQRKYVAITVVIISIVTLSLKDSLHLAHELLHAIPNPFHHHDLETHGFYHHHSDPRKSFFNHENHSHSLEDHTHTSKKETHAASSKKDKGEKNEIEKSLKTNLFVKDINQSRFFFARHSKCWQPSFDYAFLGCLYPSPPTPPPEIGA